MMTASNRARHLPLLAAGALALALAAAPAIAQPVASNGAETNDTGYGPDQYPSEQFEVIAPRPRPHFEYGRRLGAAPEKVSLSEAVPLADLDLATEDGAHALRERVRFTARNVCNRLREIVRYAQPGTPSCYSTALDSGLRHADRAIERARERRAEQYAYGY